MDYLQSAFTQVSDESKAKCAKASAEKRKAREDEERITKMDEMEQQQGPSSSTSTKPLHAEGEEEVPQPGCSRPIEYRTIKAVLPDIDDDLIEASHSLPKIYTSII